MKVLEIQQVGHEYGRFYAWGCAECLEGAESDFHDVNVPSAWAHQQETGHKARVVEIVTWEFEKSPIA